MPSILGDSGGLCRLCRRGLLSCNDWLGLEKVLAFLSVFHYFCLLSNLLIRDLLLLAPHRQPLLFVLHLTVTPKNRLRVHVDKTQFRFKLYAWKLLDHQLLHFLFVFLFVLFLGGHFRLAIGQIVFVCEVAVLIFDFVLRWGFYDVFLVFLELL